MWIQAHLEKTCRKSYSVSCKILSTYAFGDTNFFIQAYTVKLHIILILFNQFKLYFLENEKRIMTKVIWTSNHLLAK